MGVMDADLANLVLTHTPQFELAYRKIPVISPLSHDSIVLPFVLTICFLLNVHK